MIVATAGHIDHGKTVLVKALSGVDTDRLPEEKRRGMTIEPGFAYRPLAESTETRQRLGRPAIGHRLELYGRHAMPLVILVAMILATAVALRLGRRQSLATALAAGTLVGFSIWLVSEIAKMTGSAGAVPAWLSSHITLLLLVFSLCLAWTMGARRGIAE